MIEFFNLTNVYGFQDTIYNFLRIYFIASKFKICIKGVKVTSLEIFISLTKCNATILKKWFQTSRQMMIYKYRRNLKEILIFSWIKKHGFIRVFLIFLTYMHTVIFIDIFALKLGVYMSPVSTRNMSMPTRSSVGQWKRMKRNFNDIPRHPTSLLKMFHGVVLLRLSDPPFQSYFKRSQTQKIVRVPCNSARNIA